MLSALRMVLKDRAVFVHLFPAYNTFYLLRLSLSDANNSLKSAWLLINTGVNYSGSSESHLIIYTTSIKCSQNSYWVFYFKD